MTINELLMLAAITVLSAWFALRFAAVKTSRHGATTDAGPLQDLPYTSYVVDHRRDELHATR